MLVVIDKEHPKYHFSYSDVELQFTHTLTVPFEHAPTDDALFRVSMYSRPKNSSFYKVSGVSVSEFNKLSFEEALNCQIEILTYSENLQPKTITECPANTVLSFSGGLDSIAAKVVLGSSAKLMSIDFGGDYAREAKFFKNFDTSIFKWELRGHRPEQKSRFNEGTDWRFLISPALIMSDGKTPLGVATGTILEASDFWFSGKIRRSFTSYAQKTLGPGVVILHPVACLSEFGTAMVAVKNLSSSDLLASLDSLASPGFFKYYRKQVLISIVNESTLPKRNGRIKKYKFGSSFSDDMVALYVAWKAGEAWSLENYIEYLPEGWNRLDMSFFEKINVENLKVLDPSLADKILSKLLENGLKKALPEDLKNLEDVAHFYAGWKARRSFV